MPQGSGKVLGHDPNKSFAAALISHSALLRRRAQDHVRTFVQDTERGPRTHGLSDKPLALILIANARSQS